MVGGIQTIIKVEAFDALNKSYTIADNKQISKGLFMILVDPRTASYALGSSAATASDLPLAGITNAEKKASDGSTQIGLWQVGVFDVVASGAITRGTQVLAVVDNFVIASPSAIFTSSSLAIASAGIFGARKLFALETATDGERIEVEMK